MEVRTINVPSSSSNNQNGVDSAPKSDEDDALGALDLLPITNDDEFGSVAYQVVSLDENAVLHVWVIVEFPPSSSLPEREGLGDIHMKYDSRVRVTHTGTLAFPNESVRALNFELNPRDTSDVLVSCDTGMQLVFALNHN